MTHELINLNGFKDLMTSTQDNIIILSRISILSRPIPNLWKKIHFHWIRLKFEFFSIIKWGVEDYFEIQFWMGSKNRPWSVGYLRTSIEDLQLIPSCSLLHFSSMFSLSFETMIAYSRESSELNTKICERND